MGDRVGSETGQNLKRRAFLPYNLEEALTLDGNSFFTMDNSGTRSPKTPLHPSTCSSREVQGGADRYLALIAPINKLATALSACDAFTFVYTPLISRISPCSPSLGVGACKI